MCAPLRNNVDIRLLTLTSMKKVNQNNAGVYRSTQESQFKIGFKQNQNLGHEVKETHIIELVNQNKTQRSQLLAKDTEPPSHNNTTQCLPTQNHSKTKRPATQNQYRARDQSSKMSPSWCQTARKCVSTVLESTDWLLAQRLGSCWPHMTQCCLCGSNDRQMGDQ